MKNLPLLVSVLLLFTALHATGQDDTGRIKEALRAHINILAAPAMQGRGYVNGGRECAAAYINKTFAGLKMKPPVGMKTMRQEYRFPVNTFPGKMKLALNGSELVAGRDFLVDAASVSYSGTNMEVRKKDLSTVADMAAWKKVKASLDDDYVWYLENTDSFCKNIGIRAHALAAMLPEGCFLIAGKTKQMWTVAQQPTRATVFYVNSTALPADVATATIDVQAKLVADAKNENIIATIPGTITDSFIVFSAHYDHLGKMGGDALFPGASDNASGTAMLLYLAEYFARHPQRYTMVFIAFSGEEVGLLGSEYFVANAPFSLQRIRFLTNVDIMGDATDGVTVVNATVRPGEFTMLTSINEQHKYLPAVKSRGKAANSDHYHFSEKGVPAFFIYSNGGKGYYHDIYDTADEITLSNITGVARLLIDFVAQLQK